MASSAPDEGPSKFPTDIEQFHLDPRISFSKLDNKYLLETNGQEFLFDEVLKRWVFTVDEELIRQHSEYYKVEGVDENEPVHVAKKRKAEEKAHEKKAKPKKQRQNTAIYVSSIPLDADSEEIRAFFARFGLIAEEIDSGRPRIKMYYDENGKFKGDALVVYFRPESVGLAIQLSDDSDFRPGVQDPSGRVKVEAADNDFKSQKETNSSNRYKQKIIARTEQMNRKLADWDDDPDTTAEKDPSQLKYVVLKHMFTFKELESDATAILDIKEDILEEAEKYGNVTKVVLYDKEPEGIVTVRFADAEAARQCCKVMNGRFFSENRVEAYVSEGRERFRKTDEGRTDLKKLAEGGVVDDAEEEERLDQFGAWLEKKEEPAEHTKE